MCLSGAIPRITRHAVNKTIDAPYGYVVLDTTLPHWMIIKATENMVDRIIPEVLLSSIYFDKMEHETRNPCINFIRDNI